MKNYRIPFSGPQNEDDFRTFAKETDGNIISNDTIQMSGRIAKGMVKKCHPDAGLYVRAWDLSFRYPVDLCKPPRSAETDDNSFRFIAVLTPQASTLKTIGEHRQYSKALTRSILFLSDDIKAEFEMHPYQHMQMLDMTIAPYWLADNFGSIKLSGESLNDIIESGTPLVITTPCSGRINLLTGQLLDTVLQNGDYTEPIKSLSSILLTEYFGNLQQGGSRETSGNTDMYYKKIMEAESIILEHLQKQLPNVNDIAQQVALSESTLKRYFKVIFGKSVYEYYLERKMEVAKNLLTEKPVTVNEAAEIMGYEKVSNFIEIFKKHHGFSPGTIKKKKIAG